MALLCLYFTGMGTVNEARQVLVVAEGRLRQLIERGVREQRYGEVAEIAGLAQGVAALLQGRAPVLSTSFPVVSAERRQRGGPGVAVPSRESVARSGKPGYPRFERDGDKLVKVGWSKKNKAAYEHRAPREAVVAFSRHLSRSVQEGKLFAVEDLLPVPDPATSGELPAYQVYLVLAWLRHVGAIDKRGRDGYVLRRSGLSDAILDEHWERLPVRPARRKEATDP